MWRSILIHTLFQLVGCLVYATWVVAQPPAQQMVSSNSHASVNGPRSMQVSVAGSIVVGLPIHWGAFQGAILSRDGSMHIFEQSEIRDHEILRRVFRPQSMTDARAELSKELGPRFEVVIAGPYVIAAPVGQVQRWRERFVALNAGFRRYFEVRGWRLRNPDFPLCVIVFPNREQFVHNALKETSRLPQNVVGTYFPMSNRCMLYNLEARSGTDWDETEATIMHEATHQLAYNSGMHERLFENPLWYVEGLATMFEIPAVYDAKRQSSSLVDRFSPARVARLQAMLQTPENVENAIRSLIANDDLFRSVPEVAYDLSWAMNFYFVERMPNAYHTFTELQKSRRFGGYEDAERISDFRRAFQVSPSQIALELQRLFVKK